MKRTPLESIALFVIVIAMASAAVFTLTRNPHRFTEREQIIRELKVIGLYDRYDLLVIGSNVIKGPVLFLRAIPELPVLVITNQPAH